MRQVRAARQRNGPEVRGDPCPYRRDVECLPDPFEAGAPQRQHRAGDLAVGILLVLGLVLLPGPVVVAGTHHRTGLFVGTYILGQVVRCQSLRIVAPARFGRVLSASTNSRVEAESA